MSTAISPPTRSVPDVDTAADAARILAADLVATGYGIEIAAMSAGDLTLTMTVRPDMLNPHGTCHGGMIFMLCDTALALSTNTADQISLTTAASINYLAPASPGDTLTARAKVVQRGSRAGVADVEITTGDGTLVAIMRGQTLGSRRPVSGPGGAR